jgi:WD40 repeat protein
MYAPPLRQQPAPGARAGQGLRLEVTCEQGGGQDAFAVSPDGELVAISCQSGVEISLAATGRRVMSLPYHATTFAFDPQDTMLAVASNTNEVQLLSTSKSQAPRTISLFSNVSATALAFSPDNSKIAIVGSDGRVLFVDVASGKVLPDTLTNSTPITKIAFAPNGGYFATASSDEIRIWELVSDTYGLYANNGASDLGGVVSLAFSSDSAELLVGSAAAGARRYDVLDSKRETSLADSSWRLAQVAASPLDRSVALGDAAGRLALYREGGPKPLQVLRDAGPAVRGLAFMPDGKALVVRSDNGFQIWGLADQPSR